MKNKIIFAVGSILLGIALLALSPLALFAADTAPINVRVTGDTLHDLLDSIAVKSGKTLTIRSGGTLTAESGSIINLGVGTISWASVNKTGSSLVDIETRSAGALSSGTLPDARFPSTLPALNASLLTALNASALATGTLPDGRFPATLPAASGVNLTSLNASNLGSGTVPDARFPATLPAASGVNLTALNASNLASGTVPTGRLYTTAAGYNITNGAKIDAIAALSPTASQILRYNAGGTAYEFATLSPVITLSGDSSGTVTLTNLSSGTLTSTVTKVNGVAYGTSPSTNTVPVVTGSNTVTYQAVPNAALANSSITIAGNSTSLGGTVTLDSITGVSTAGFLARTAANTLTARTLTGSSNRLTVTNGAGTAGDPTFDISAAYVGQSSITTLGTIVTGIWNGTTIALANGGTGQTSASAAINALVPTQSGQNGKFLSTDGSVVSWQAVAGSGTVTSVALTAPSIFTVSGSPVTTTGTLDLALNDQNANEVFAGPTNGSDAAPTFRGLVAADIPDISSTYLTVAAAATDYQPMDADLTAIAALSSTGFAARTGSGTWAQRTIVGTADKISVADGGGVSANPTVSIAATYVGQSSITTLGTIGTGTWHSDVIGLAYGGLGADNSAATGIPIFGSGSAVITATTGSGNVVRASSPTLVTPDLGTPSNAVLTFASGLPVSTGIDGLGSGVAAFLGTPSSSNLAAAVTGETGSGALVFGTSPTLGTPTLTTPVISGAISFPSGVRQTFAPNATNSGLNVGGVSGDPSSPSNGDLWYDSSGGVFRAQANGETISLGSGDGGVSISGTPVSGQVAEWVSASAIQGVSTTGSGNYVRATSPVLVTPSLGVAAATSVNGLTVTSTTGTITIANGKTLTASNTLTFAGTDSSMLNIGTGGTLGTAAYTAASAYEVPLTFSTGLTRSTNTVTVNTSQNIATLSNLTSNGLVTTGGGAGTLSVTVPGTGVLTALGINIGSAGAPVTFNGALGTPSSGTVTNLTGTASININGTVGAMTPAAGAFTTISQSGNYLMTQSATDMAINLTSAAYVAFQLGINKSGSTNSFGVANNTAYVMTGGSVPVVIGSENTPIISVTASGASITGTLSTTGKLSSYNGITTAGNGVATIQGAGRVTAQTAAAASVATYTVGAADASFLVSANVNVTAVTTATFTTTCTYTDETNTSRTVTLNFSSLAGTFLTTITNVTGAGPYAGVPVQIRAKASTAITIATTGTFTSVTYNAEGVITKLQ